MKTYLKMTTEELERENGRLDEEMRSLRELRRVIKLVLDQRYGEAEAKRTYDNLSDAGKASLRQVLQAESIPSQEKHGTLGAKSVK